MGAQLPAQIRPEEDEGLTMAVLFSPNLQSHPRRAGYSRTLTFLEPPPQHPVRTAGVAFTLGIVLGTVLGAWCAVAVDRLGHLHAQEARE